MRVTVPESSKIFLCKEPGKKKLIKLGWVELQQYFIQFSFQYAATEDKHSKVQGHKPIGVCNQ